MITKARLDYLKKICSEATVGPWRWELNNAHKSVTLCGGMPLYDKSVMSFVRWGMTGAAPMFHFWCSKGREWLRMPKRADELRVAVAGRSHHETWFADIDHPDARFMAESRLGLPDAIKAVEERDELIKKLMAALKPFSGTGPCSMIIQGLRQEDIETAKETYQAGELHEQSQQV